MSQIEKLAVVEGPIQTEQAKPRSAYSTTDLKEMNKYISIHICAHARGRAHTHTHTTAEQNKTEILMLNSLFISILFC